MGPDSCIADSVEIHSIVRKLCAKERGLTRGHLFEKMSMSIMVNYSYY